MKEPRLFVGLLLVLALSACSDVFFQQPYRVVLEPAQVGYEADDQGKVNVVKNNAFVQASPGAPGGHLERYTYAVVDDSGYEVFWGSGSVNVEIPAGREEVGGRINYISKNSEPFTFGLDGAAAEEHLSQGAPVNWRMRITWYARTSNGTEVGWVQEHQIKYPLR
ncbi:hypothetical protein [Meiothermus cerbereus]|uniref:hypothetical protein n=1 Tax=Meiothermus cerbereus TaxID=65552 RepID=UPI003EE8E85F